MHGRCFLQFALVLFILKSCVVLQYRWRRLREIRKAIDDNEGGLETFTQCKGSGGTGGKGSEGGGGWEGERPYGNLCASIQ